MIAQTMTYGYTDPAREKKRAGIGVLNLKADNRHQRGFFMSVCLLLWADCTGCSNARRDLESGTPTCTALPTPIGVEVASGETISRRHVMSNHSIATSVASFSFENFHIRAINRNGEIWFVAADVCTVLDIKNPRSSIALLDDDESAVHSMDIRSENGVVQKRDVNIINESGLYALILRSRKPEAKRFRKWVTSEVLPAIRKTGAY